MPHAPGGFCGESMVVKKDSPGVKNKPRPGRQVVLASAGLDRISRAPVSVMIVLAAILGCYYRTLSFDFTRLDDDLLILENLDSYQDPGNWSLAFSRDAFNGTDHDFYRPVQNLSFFFDAHFSGAHPAGYKITNLLLHFLACLSLLWLLQCLDLDRRLSFLGVLAYAVHPLFNHAVIWIPARGDLLVAGFSILSYAGFIKYYRTGKSAYLAIHAGSLLLAVFSKETAVLLPFVFALHIMLLERNRRFRRIWAPGVLSLAIPAFYLACRRLVITKVPLPSEFGVEPFLYNLRTIPEFVAKFFLPMNLSVMPVFTFIATIMGLAAGAILVWMAWDAARKGQNAGWFGLAWFLLFTAVTLIYRHFLGKAAYDYLEHRAYLPVEGILICAISFAQGRLQPSHSRIVWTAGLIVIAALSAGTLINQSKYRNPMTFYESAIRSNPECAMAYYNRAKYRRMAGDSAGAMSDYNQAIEVRPDFADAYNNRGNLRKDKSDLPGAMLDYNEAIRLDGKLASAYFNRGAARMGAGDKQAALEDFSSAILLNPSYQKALINRGAIYYEFGQLDLALEDFSKAIQANSKSPDPWRNRGSVRFRMRDLSGACADWQAASARGSKDGAALERRHCR